MTGEEIERILQTVAQNQARADEEFAMLLRSQTRYDERLATISDIMHDLADKQIKNEERFAETDKRFAELAAAQVRYEARQEQLEASYQMFEEFVRDFRNETHEHFAETDKRLAELAVAQTKTDKQIKGLAMAQARTDEQIRQILDRNGSTAALKAKKKSAKKTGKRRSTK